MNVYEELCRKLNLKGIQYFFAQLIRNWMWCVLLSILCYITAAPEINYSESIPSGPLIPSD